VDVTHTVTIDMGLCTITETGDEGAIAVEISKTTLDAQTVTVENRFSTPTTDVTYALFKSDGTSPITDFDGNVADTVTLELNEDGDEFTITIPYGFFGLWDPDYASITVLLQEDVETWKIVATSCANTFPEATATLTPEYSVTLTMTIDVGFTDEGWFIDDWTQSASVTAEFITEANLDVDITPMTWYWSGGSSDCDAITATLVTYIGGELSDVNYAFAAITGTNDGANMQLIFDDGALTGDEPGGDYTFFVKFTLTNFPGTAESLDLSQEIAAVTITRGCFNIDADDMDVTCDGATDLHYYVPLNAGPVEIYLNSCTFNADYNDVCSVADQNPREEYFQIFVYKDGEQFFDNSWGFWEDIKDGSNGSAEYGTWFSTDLTPGLAADEYPSYEWQGPHKIETTTDADKGVYVFVSTYKRKFYHQFGVQFELDDPLTATVTIRDLCFAPGVELYDVTYDSNADFTYDQGVWDISDLLDDNNATKILEVPLY